MYAVHVYNDSCMILIPILFTLVAIAVPGAGTFGPGHGLIHYSLVQCTGDENILLNCPRSNDASGSTLQQRESIDTHYMYVLCKESSH